MKCIILAAGYATRMYPLTENFPKPLLEVGGKPILDWLVNDLTPVIDQFILISNHKYANHFVILKSSSVNPSKTFELKTWQHFSSSLNLLTLVSISLVKSVL